MEGRVLAGKSMLSEENDKVRIDKWLWAVRVYKTRSLAAEACGAGKVLMRERKVKPSRGVGVGEVIRIKGGGMVRTLRVKALAERRMGAGRVPEFMEDLTSPAEYERKREQASRAGPLVRSRGEGRPTKRERRILDLLRRME